MKSFLLVALAAIPLFATSVNFIYDDYDYDDYGDEYWYDEYWDHGYHHHYHHDYYVYYPHGYYCVYYAWYHPWWWDWYWWHCHWCHHFDWHFFGAGYYVVWYENDCWWWRPRYGRVVRYKLPYTYHEFRYKAMEYGHKLPEKPGKEIDIPYNDKEVIRLTKEKDPDLYTRLEKEEKSGNLEKMRKDYEKTVKKEIAIKNEEYRKTKSVTDDRSLDQKYQRKTDDERNFTKPVDKEKTIRDESRIIRKPRDGSGDDRENDNDYRKPDENDRDNKPPQYNKSINKNEGENDDGENYRKNTKGPIRNLPPPVEEKKDKKPSGFTTSKPRR